MLQTMDGGCHCGRVRFRVTGDLAQTTYCNCSVCTKKGILHLIVPPEQFELLSGADELATYRFNTGTAQHMFC
ncbi:MAG: GFA family protein, partial [Xanthobacteraceae bacterium]